MIKVAVTGAAGRMGSGIIRKITEQEDMEVRTPVRSDRNMCTSSHPCVCHQRTVQQGNQ